MAGAKPQKDSAEFECAEGCGFQFMGAAGFVGGAQFLDR
jgi:hypothetical protein